MKRLVSFLFWILLFLLLFLGIDQSLVHVEMPLPVLTEVRTFYVDFRGRLLQLGDRESAKPGVAERKAAAPVQPRTAGPATPSPVGKSTPAKPEPVAAEDASNPRYLYVDGEGELRFADRLEEVPAAYRKDAQRLEK